MELLSISRIMIIYFQISSDKADSPVEPQPLWEYPGKALSLPFRIANFDFSEDINKQARINSVVEVPIIV